MKTKLFLANLLLAALLLAGCGSSSKWKEFRSKVGNFSVKAPVALEEQPQSSDLSIGKASAHTYLAESDGILYAVAYTEFRQEIIDAGDPEEMLSNARDTMITSLSGELVLETRKSLGNFPGRELVVDTIMPDYKYGVMKARIYLVNNRLYQVMALVDKMNADTSAITRFLDSFKLIDVD
jgi:hypothetical protein